MSRLHDGTYEIELVQKDDEVIVTLESDQYQLDGMEHLSPFLQGNDILLEGKIQSATEDALVLSYTLPSYVMTLAEAVLSYDTLERIALTRKYSSLLRSLHQVVCYFLHPENIYIVSGQIKVAHRGIYYYLAPHSADAELMLKQYKALVISTLSTKYNYDLLIKGEAKVREPLSREIYEAQDITSIEQILDKQYHALYQEEKYTYKKVKKIRYAALMILSTILLTVSMALGVWTVYTQASTVPLKGRMIESKSAYMVNNFGQTVSILAQDDPRDMPASVQYMLASSYVQLENLTNEQKRAILNNLSPNSNTNELLYWIYSGRGMFEESLSIAQNIGNYNLILHAYTKLYDMVMADPIMPGNEKQTRLAEYRQRIDDLLDILQGHQGNHELQIHTESEDVDE